MEFTMFQNCMEAEVRRLVSEGTSVSICSIKKNNGINMQALCIRDPGEDLSPLIYLNEFYARYKEGCPISTLSRQIVERFQSVRTGNSLPDHFLEDYDAVKNRIYIKLIHREKNEDLLANVPYDDFLDLCKVFYYEMDDTFRFNGSITINVDLLRKWGVDISRVEDQAFENCLRDKPAVFRPLSDVLKDYSETEDLMEAANNPALYVLTSRTGIFGASCCCYPDQFAWIGHKLNSDYYILPSSIHECLILPEDMTYNTDFLKKMVREINRDQVDPQEVLSDNIYHYELLTGCIEIIS